MWVQESKEDKTFVDMSSITFQEKRGKKSSEYSRGPGSMVSYRRDLKPSAYKINNVTFREELGTEHRMYGLLLLPGMTNVTFWLFSTEGAPLPEAVCSPLRDLCHPPPKFGPKTIEKISITIDPPERIPGRKPALRLRKTPFTICC